MNRAQAAYAMLKEKGTVRMGDLPREGLMNAYTGRNSFSEAKPLAAADGFVIVHAYGKTWQDNSYTLQAIPAESEGPTIKAACHKCGNVFEARQRDVKAGNGRYCSRRCAGAYRSKKTAKGQPRANLQSLAPIPDGLQQALL